MGQDPSPECEVDEFSGHCEQDTFHEWIDGIDLFLHESRFIDKEHIKFVEFGLVGYAST